MSDHDNDNDNDNDVYIDIGSNKYVKNEQTKIYGSSN